VFEQCEAERNGKAAKGEIRRRTIARLRWPDAVGLSKRSIWQHAALRSTVAMGTDFQSPPRDIFTEA